MSAQILSFPPRLSHQQRMQLSVLRFIAGTEHDVAFLFALSPRQWRRLLFWLDVAGLTLYLFAELRRLGLDRRLPCSVDLRLCENLSDNTQRIQAMARESVALQLEFQRRGLSYLCLKGFSLQPHSVALIELRSQLDLDFLVAEEDLPPAQQVLAQRSYHLSGHSGRSWEYKDGQEPRTSIRHLYKELGSRSVELHAASEGAGRELLDRPNYQSFWHITMPVLQPAELFLGQAMHLYKHLIADGTRGSHILELYRHIRYRQGDTAFWEEVCDLSHQNVSTRFGLAFVLAMVSHTIGVVEQEAPVFEASERLPQFAQRWIDRFGNEAVLGRFGGNKLSAILLDELRAHGLASATGRPRKAIPTRLPPRIEQPRKGETQLQRLGRNFRQLRFILTRLRFHVVEGARLELERRRWKSAEPRPQQTSDNSLTRV